MWMQRLIWFLGRMIFYLLLLPVMFGLIYTLAHGQMRAAVIFLVLFVLILYFGLVRIRIAANSVVVRDDKVVFFIPEKTVRDRFDFVSRSQKIVELPSFGLLDRAYVVEIFFADNGGVVNACRLSLKLGYLMDQTGWQRAYDNFIRYQERLPIMVKRQLYDSGSRIVLHAPPEGEEDLEEYSKPIVAELNSGLENLGLTIEEATCTLSAGRTLARIVSDEQAIVERPV